MTGDGVHAAFADPVDALLASVQLQMHMLEAERSFGVPMRVRCGMHAGAAERRDNDYYGSEVNRAARIMGAAHGGQMLVSRSIAETLAGRMPEGVALRDLGEVRLRDLARPERIYQVVHPALRRDFPALRSLAEVPNNLPSALSTFIGRERELKDLGAMLEKSRLVTVVGMGGVGKTRLSLHAAAEALDAFPDGVWLVELAGTHDARLVPQAIASALGVQQEPGRDVEESLARHCRDRALLVLLDNCEHLREACARTVHRLLSAAPRMKVLATSREALGITGEACHPLSGLPVPGPRDAVDGEAASAFESVRLFIDRARAVNPGFDPAEHGPAIAAICHRLDGIPLAIELAAARTRSLSVQQIALRLNDRFRLLGASHDPTVPSKQRTLRALIDWSYELLPEGERAIFERMAVFAGGCTLAAAEHVCGAEPGDAAVLDALGRLADKSLVAFDAAADRYRMLETVREYAQSRLVESGAEAAIRERHFAFFLGFANEARAGLVGPEQAKWLGRLDGELDNLLAAHRSAASTVDGAAAGVALVSALKFYWINRGLLELGRRITLEALERSGVPEAARCKGLFHAGQIAYVMGRYAEAGEYLRESLVLAERVGDDRVLAAVWQPLGLAALGEGDRGAARKYLERAVELARSREDRRELAAGLSALAMVLRAEGRVDEALRSYEEVLAISRDLGDRESEAIALINRALLTMGAAAADAAQKDLTQALALAEPLASPRIDQCLLDACAALAAMAHEFDRASRLFEGAEACARTTGMRRDPTDEAFLAPLAARSRAALGRDYRPPVIPTAPTELLREARQWLRERIPPSPHR